MFDWMPSGDSYLQNRAEVQNFNSITPVMLNVYLYSAANGRIRFCSPTLTSRHVWTKESVDVGKGARFLDDFLIVKKLPLPHVGAGDGFQRLRRSFAPRGLGITGLVWENQHTPLPPCQTSPHRWPSWGSNTSRTTLGLRYALFTTVLQQTPFCHGCTGTSGLPVAATCFCEGSVMKLGSMICPFFCRISCNTSCDVTD